MGYPPFEPEEEGADKFYTACFYLLFSLFIMFLLATCLFSAGLALVIIVPVLIPTVIIARLVEKKAKSPTVRQVAIYYQFNIFMFCCSTPLFALAYYFVFSNH